MAYKCYECGHIFEEGEEARWEEDRGEFWGMPCTETMTGCPNCKGGFEKTVRCKNCLGEFLSEELEDELCDECRGE